MKLSVSLPAEDITFVDAYADRTGSGSRSAVLHQAIELLRLADLEAEYSGAFAEWDAGEDSALWNGTSGDGIADAPR